MAAAIIANKLQKKRGYYALGIKTTKEIVRIKIDAGSEVCVPISMLKVGSYILEKD